MESRLSFQEAVDALSAASAKPWRMGLDRMNALVDELGLADYVRGQVRPKYFHVAGTNGKGSSVCMLQHLLVAHGFQTGTSCSPFVYDVRERVQLNLDLITHEAFARLTSRLIAASEALEKTEFGGASEFELKTALGFLYWQENGVEAVALETGMGGRLDASNVVVPACSVITSIGLDHMEHLGDTVEKIAAEKGGIIKPGVPVVIGQVGEGPAKVLEQIAADLGCSVWRFGRDFRVKGTGDQFSIVTPVGRFDGLKTGLMGEIQHINAATAVASLQAAGVDLDPEKVREALMHAVWPGRFEVHEFAGMEVALDGGHNAQSAKILAGICAEKWPGARVGVVFGMLKGHDPVVFARELAGVAERFGVVQAPTPRAMLRSEIQQQLAAGGLEATEYDSILQALEAFAVDGIEKVLVCGSFYLLEEAHKAVGKG